MRGARYVQQVRHWLRHRLGSPALILMYHRVATLANDPHLLAVTPERFAEQLGAIRRHARPMRLRDLVNALRAGHVPKGAVVITFDDGYADNLHAAEPALSHHDVPATVFITAGRLGGEREFWWDELDRLLLQPGTLPPVLELRVNGARHTWRLGADAHYSEEEFQRRRHWHIESADDPGQRQQLFRALFDLLYRMPSVERWKILDGVTVWAGARPVARESHRTLTPAEAVRLAQRRPIDIGAHTMSHPLLAALPVEEQRREILESKASLEALLHREVASFAYPHGSTTAEARSTLEESGFQVACTSEAEAVFRGADRLHLPRLVVRNWDGQSFARWLRWWTGQ